MLEALRPISKMIAGALAGAAVVWMTKNNIIIADGFQDALEVLIGGIVTAAIVYLSPSNTKDGYNVTSR